ncbi:MAG: trypsin-like serine protease [Chloroflexi bacterium]|nr:MAG: trypsin-like serine protease [Chloroflexota bacterium]TMD70038.1 MAG: trypsin-like serine protease [Chloroflexota bacterium]
MRIPLIAAAVLVTVAAAIFLWQVNTSLRSEVASEGRTITQLQGRVSVLESRSSSQADWSSVAARVEPSVVKIEAGDATGSGWVVRSGASGSELVTNYHVIAESWSAGNSKVDVRQEDRTLKGTIVRVDSNDDLAVIRVSERLPALMTASVRPMLGTPVMAIGSPLGLDGTVTLGVVSGFRSLDGSDYVQFSAPISPGNSGGPVIDSRGHVVAVASAKLIGTGVEALSLAIPVQVVCLSLVSCSS